MCQDKMQVALRVPVGQAAGQVETAAAILALGKVPVVVVLILARAAAVPLAEKAERRVLHPRNLDLYMAMPYCFHCSVDRVEVDRAMALLVAVAAAVQSLLQHLDKSIYRGTSTPLEEPSTAYTALDEVVVA